MAADALEDPRRLGVPDADAVNLALLGLRLILGAVMLAHGINHIFGGGKIAGTGRWFESLGMKPGPLDGQHHRIAGGACCSAWPRRWRARSDGMLVALFTNHLKNSFFIFRRAGGLQVRLPPSPWWRCCLAMLGISVIWRAPKTGDMNSWTDLPHGRRGGAALLLAVFWRPAKPAADAG